MVGGHQDSSRTAGGEPISQRDSTRKEVGACSTRLLLRAFVIILPAIYGVQLSAGVEIKMPSIGGSQWEALSLMHAAKQQA
eukprot:1156281-Pelagomonas_calceolata.AAC.1